MLPGDIGRAVRRAKTPGGSQKAFPVGISLLACEYMVYTFPNQSRKRCRAAGGKGFQAFVLTGFQLNLSSNHLPVCYHSDAYMITLARR